MLKGNRGCDDDNPDFTINPAIWVNVKQDKGERVRFVKNAIDLPHRNSACQNYYQWIDQVPRIFQFRMVSMN